MFTLITVASIISFVYGVLDTIEPSGECKNIATSTDAIFLPNNNRCYICPGSTCNPPGDANSNPTCSRLNNLAMDDAAKTALTAKCFDVSSNGCNRAAIPTEYTKWDSFPLSCGSDMNSCPPCVTTKTACPNGENTVPFFAVDSAPFQNFCYISGCILDGNGGIVRDFQAFDYPPGATAGYLANNKPMVVQYIRKRCPVTDLCPSPSQWIFNSCGCPECYIPTTTAPDTTTAATHAGTTKDSTQTTAAATNAATTTSNNGGGATTAATHAGTTKDSTQTTAATNIAPSTTHQCTYGESCFSTADICNEGGSGGNSASKCKICWCDQMGVTHCEFYSVTMSDTAIMKLRAQCQIPSARCSNADLVYPSIYPDPLHNRCLCPHCPVTTTTAPDTTTGSNGHTTAATHAGTTKDSSQTTAATHAYTTTATNSVSTTKHSSGTTAATHSVSTTRDSTITTQATHAVTTKDSSQTTAATHAYTTTATHSVSTTKDSSGTTKVTNAGTTAATHAGTTKDNTQTTAATHSVSTTRDSTGTTAATHAGTTKDTSQTTKATHGYTTTATHSVSTTRDSSGTTAATHAVTTKDNTHTTAATHGVSTTRDSTITTKVTHGTNTKVDHCQGTYYRLGNEGGKCKKCECDPDTGNWDCSVSVDQNMADYFLANNGDKHSLYCDNYMDPVRNECKDYTDWIWPSVPDSSGIAGRYDCCPYCPTTTTSEPDTSSATTKDDTVTTTRDSTGSTKATHAETTRDDGATTTGKTDDASTTKRSDDTSTTKRSDDASTTKRSDDVSTTRTSHDTSTTKRSDDASTTTKTEDTTTTEFVGCTEDAHICSDKTTLAQRLPAHDCDFDCSQDGCDDTKCCGDEPMTECEAVNQCEASAGFTDPPDQCSKKALKCSDGVTFLSPNECCGFDDDQCEENETKPGYCDYGRVKYGRVTFRNSDDTSTNAAGTDHGTWDLCRLCLCSEIGQRVCNAIFDFDSWDDATKVIGWDPTEAQEKFTNACLEDTTTNTALLPASGSGVCGWDDIGVKDVDDITECGCSAFYCKGTKNYTPKSLDVNTTNGGNGYEYQYGMMMLFSMLMYVFMA